MRRRAFLKLLAAAPLLGFLKPADLVHRSQVWWGPAKQVYPGCMLLNCTTREVMRVVKVRDGVPMMEVSTEKGVSVDDECVILGYPSSEPGIPLEFN